MTPRARSIRRSIIQSIHSAGRGHYGGSLSCVEILESLYFGAMRHDPKRPNWPERDRFILSKGHAGAALYATLAEAGYFPKSELLTLNQRGRLGEHPDRRIPGVECNTGSLGHGLGIACGIAYAAKMARQSFRTYVLLSDGECWEGSTWEAAAFAAHHELSITAIVDRNHCAIAGDTETINSIEPLCEKWQAFGWALNINAGMARAQIWLTRKGEGISFMEGRPEWHHGALSPEQYEQAMDELAPELEYA